MNATIYNGLKFFTRMINLNFRIKISGVDENGKKINTLVGVAGLINAIGIELANKFLAKAFDKGLDKLVCKLRRGIKISFYAK